MLNSSDLTFMRSVQEASLPDTGYRLVYTEGSADSYGKVAVTYPPSASSTPCGLEMKSGEVRDRDTMTLIRYDAILRLPIDFTIDARDHFQVTKRHGESITALTFELRSPPQRGSSGIRVLLGIREA